jgi:hypothetical protein
MKTAILIITVFVLALFTVSVEPFANGPNGSSTVMAMMGSGGGGGNMGGHGMSGIGEWILKLWKGLSGEAAVSKQQKMKETEMLRQLIREKRRELSSLVRSPIPDKELIEDKIYELNGLESELDRTIEGY